MKCLVAVNNHSEYDESMYSVSIGRLFYYRFFRVCHTVIYPLAFSRHDHYFQKRPLSANPYTSGSINFLHVL